MAPQFTSFNPYQQQAQQEAMQVGRNLSCFTYWHIADHLTSLLGPIYATATGVASPATGGPAGSATRTAAAGPARRMESPAATTPLPATTGAAATAAIRASTASCPPSNGFRLQQPVRTLYFRPVTSTHAIPPFNVELFGHRLFLPSIHLRPFACAASDLYASHVSVCLSWTDLTLPGRAPAEKRRRARAPCQSSRQS